jgi:hypothetical protein
MDDAGRGLFIENAGQLVRNVVVLNLLLSFLQEGLYSCLYFSHLERSLELRIKVAVELRFVRRNRDDDRVYIFDQHVEAGLLLR